MDSGVHRYIIMIRGLFASTALDDTSGRTHPDDINDEVQIELPALFPTKEHAAFMSSARSLLLPNKTVMGMESRVSISQAASHSLRTSIGPHRASSPRSMTPPLNRTPQRPSS